MWYLCAENNQTNLNGYNNENKTHDSVRRPVCGGECVGTECGRTFLKGADCYNAGNDTQAFSYFEKAANQGFATAQNNLSQMYEYGLGVTKDLQKAAYWKKYKENPNK